jgi:hypothetical protein
MIRQLALLQRGLAYEYIRIRPPTAAAVSSWRDHILIL